MIISVPVALMISRDESLFFFNFFFVYWWKEKRIRVFICEVISVISIYLILPCVFLSIVLKMLNIIAICFVLSSFNLKNALSWSKWSFHRDHTSDPFPGIFWFCLTCFQNTFWNFFVYFSSSMQRWDFCRFWSCYKVHFSQISLYSI